MTALGVVPARGGSKGMPRKNIRLLNGLPLIAHTLRTARAATLLDRLVVSTEDADIAEIAASEGVEVIERPAALATDASPTEEALVHALETIEARDGWCPDWVVTLEPTSPLRTAALIDRCIALANERNAGAVITVAEVRESLGRIEGDRFRLLFPGQPRRRQDRHPLYRESSTVWVTRTATLRCTRSVLAEPLFPVIVSAEEATDVNTLLDFAIAEALLQARRGDKTWPS